MTGRESLAETGQDRDWEMQARARAIVAEHQGQPGALLPLLHAIQAEFGCVEPSVVPVLAEGLNLSVAEVHGVVTFYHDLRHARPGRHVIKVCQAEACQAVGADSLLAHVRRSLGVDRGGTPPDDAFTVDVVYCLGNCALGPTVMIDDVVHGRVTPARFDALADVRRRAAP